MNLRDLKIRNSKICDCGYEFSAKEIKKLEKNNDYRYYGGRVQYYTEATCPKCKKNVILYLEAYNNSYRIIDIAEIEATIKNEETDKTSNEFICPNCKKSFKNKAGLSVHLRSCKK